MGREPRRARPPHLHQQAKRDAKTARGYDIEVVARRYEPGECVVLVSVTVVALCLTIYLASGEGSSSGSAFPSGEAFAGVLESDCEQPADDYAGTELEETNYVASLFVPTESSWNLGSRLMSCGIEGSRLPSEPAPMLDQPIGDLVAQQASTTTTR